MHATQEAQGSWTNLGVGNLKATRRQYERNKGRREKHLYNSDVPFFRFIAFGERFRREYPKAFRSRW